MSDDKFMSNEERDEADRYFMRLPFKSEEEYNLYMEEFKKTWCSGLTDNDKYDSLKDE